MAEFLSPSSLNLFLNQPYTWYCSKILRLNKKEQIDAASYGGGFDYVIKKHLIETKFPDKSTKLPELLAQIEQLDNKKFILTGEYVKDIYLVHCQHQFTDVELQKKFTFRNIPFFVKLDATCLHKDKNVTFDWKCRGFASSASPSKGYYRAYDKQQLYPAHKDKVPDISDGFLKQFTIYNWSLGYSVDEWEEFDVCWDEICKSATGNYKVANYAYHVGIPYQKELYSLCELVWNQVKDDKFPHPIYPIGIMQYISSELESWF